VRVTFFINDLDVIQLDVQELIHRDQHSCDGQVILELHGHGLAHKGLEE